MENLKEIQHIVPFFFNRLVSRLFSMNIFYQYKCPVCDSKVKSFQPFGLKPRPNAQCPICKSLERHRLIWLYFRDRTNLFIDKLKMLHIAPEVQISKLLKNLPTIDYLSGDMEPGRAMIRIDITDIKYPDHTFDVVYASHVLEHIPDDRRAMRELCRVLKPQGWAILQVPIFGEKTLEDPNITDPQERERFFGQYDHVRKYGNDGKYKERLEDSGFIVEVEPCTKLFQKEEIVRYGLSEYEDVYYCTKRQGENDEINESFEKFIIQKAQEYGFGEPTKSQWIKYMVEDFQRAKPIIKSVVDYFNIPLISRHRAIDIGCGFGGMCKALKEFFEEVAGVEYASERVEWAKKRVSEVDIQNCNAVKIPWPNDHFDLIVSNDVLEHVSFEEQHRVVAEMMRVCKPGGYSYVSVPNRFQMMDEHNKVWFGTYLPKFLRHLYVKSIGTNKRYLHCYERTRFGWNRLFKSHGFKVILEPTGFYKGNPKYPPQRWNVYLWKN